MKKLLFGLLWFVVLYFLFCAGVGAVAGAKAGSQYTNTAAAQRAGQIAGAKAVSENLGFIVGGALTLAILGSGFGLLPGTRQAAPVVESEPFCHDYGQVLSEPGSNCLHSGQRTHKTVAEAYGSPNGLGLFDLIPGIRDLPHQVRKGLMIVVVFVVVGLINLGPQLFKLYHHLAK